MSTQVTAHLLPAVLLTLMCSPPRVPPEVPKRVPPIAAADVAMEEQSPACVRFWPEARYRNYAYDHVVHLNSRCHRVASCNVSTDVNPAVVVVAIAPDERLEVVTSRASQTPEFTPIVECTRGSR
jgi:hypothetical protein